jgi:flagellar hook assembly protein FlgD
MRTLVSVIAVAAWAGSTWAQTSAAAPVDYSLASYDLVGQCVRVLVDQAERSGAHRVAWDARDDQGRDLGSGLYVCRLETGSTAVRRSVVLLR